jgi:hypothetical protein
MAIEIMNQRLFYQPVAEIPATLLLEQLMVAPSTTYPRSVHHNFQHDVESFFWLLLWTLTGRLDDDKIQNYSKSIFQNSPFCPEPRYRVIVNTREELYCLQTMAPKEMQPLYSYLPYLGARLHKAYVEREYRFEDLTTYCDIICAAYDVLQSYLNYISSSDIPALNMLKVYTTSGDADLGIAPPHPILDGDEIPKQVPKKTLWIQRPVAADDKDYEPPKESRSSSDKQYARPIKRARRE